MDKFDKRVKATRKLIEVGFRLVRRSEKDRIQSKKDWDRRMKESNDRQDRTDRKLDRLIDSWARQRSNGHSR